MAEPTLLQRWVERPDGRLELLARLRAELERLKGSGE